MPNHLAAHSRKMRNSTILSLYCIGKELLADSQTIWRKICFFLSPSSLQTAFYAHVKQPPFMLSVGHAHRYHHDAGDVDNVGKSGYLFIYIHRGYHHLYYSTSLFFLLRSVKYLHHLHSTSWKALIIRLCEHPVDVETPFRTYIQNYIRYRFLHSKDRVSNAQSANQAKTCTLFPMQAFTRLPYWCSFCTVRM